LVFFVPLSFVPLILLVARQAMKLKKPWKLHLALVGVLLSTTYLMGLLYGTFRYWLFNF
jgi:hypothetical protein